MGPELGEVITNLYRQKIDPLLFNAEALGHLVQGPPAYIEMAERG